MGDNLIVAHLQNYVSVNLFTLPWLDVGTCYIEVVQFFSRPSSQNHCKLFIGETLFRWETNMIIVTCILTEAARNWSYIKVYLIHLVKSLWNDYSSNIASLSWFELGINIKETPKGLMSLIRINTKLSLLSPKGLNLTTNVCNIWNVYTIKLALLVAKNN